MKQPLLQKLVWIACASAVLLAGCVESSGPLPDDLNSELRFREVTDGTAEPTGPSKTEGSLEPEDAGEPEARVAVRDSAADVADARGGYGEKEPPADRKPLFVGWRKPAATVVITGRQHGFIEPCGCTGLANQKGGLARTDTLLQQLKEKDWNVAAVDAGNQIRRFGRQPEIKFQVTLEALNRMNYGAVGFGPDDLRISFGELAAAVVGESSPFVSANVNVLDLTPTHRVIQAGGKNIGVTTVLGEAAQQQVGGDDVVLTDPEQALEKVRDELTASNCDYHILLFFGTPDEASPLAKKFPLFDVVAAAGGGGEPLSRPEPVEGGGVVIQVGEKGMYAAVVGFYDDPQTPLRYQRTPLDDRFADSPRMLKLLASYQETLKDAGLEGLNIKPAPHPSGHAFVGSQKCGECHTTAFEIWEGTRHAHGTDSLVHPHERSEIPRHYDPECLSCHVTGWNPQKYYPYQSGYLSLAGTPLMHNVGCENCHGPGSEHVAVEEGAKDADEATVAKLRDQMRLPLAKAEETCLQCHDLDNSPDFHTRGAFERYWKKVEHVGKY